MKETVTQTGYTGRQEKTAKLANAAYRSRTLPDREPAITTKEAGDAGRKARLYRDSTNQKKSGRQKEKALAHL